MRTDDQTYQTKTAAEACLIDIEADVRRRAWVDPDAGRVSVKEYEETWIAERDLEDRTRELYTGYLRNHIGPTLGSAMLCELSAPRMRSWRNTLQQQGVGAPTVARCYSLLRAVLNTAVDDEILKRNPCRYLGRGRPTLIEDSTPMLHISHALAELNSGARRLKGPKSNAGKRGVALPAAILPEIREQLERYAERGPGGRLE